MQLGALDADEGRGGAVGVVDTSGERAGAGGMVDAGEKTSRGSRCENKTRRAEGAVAEGG